MICLNDTSWGTLDEINFINGLGNWSGNGRKSDSEILQLLLNYKEALSLRKNLEDIRLIDVMKVVEDRIGVYQNRVGGLCDF